MSTKNTLSDARILEAMTKYGSQRKAAKKLGIARTTLQDRLYAMQDKGYATPTAAVSNLRKIKRPQTGVTRVILTSAQTNTPIWRPFWDNLTAYAEWIGADIFIAGFHYQNGKTKNKNIAYDPEIDLFVTDSVINIANRVMFCAEVPIAPTAVSPLSGFEGYTHNMWGVFPHPKVQLTSVPVTMNVEPKHIMTTGCVTLPNYSMSKAGLKAHFHHVYGAVIVEIDSDGDFFCRHLIADNDGTFHDLDVCVEHGKVSTEIPVEAITYGDIHPDQLDDDVAAGTWGITQSADGYWVSTSDGADLTARLAPRYQFFHDTLDFRRRNHHNIGDPHFRYKMHVEGTDSVEQELRNAASFLAAAINLTGECIVVDSNHDRALTRWLKTADYRADPINAQYFLRLQLACYDAIRLGDEDFNIVPYAMEEAAPNVMLDHVTFLKETDTFRIADGRIECAIHGDKGINGSKGALKAYAKGSAKMNVADKHSAGIFDGVYMAGHSSKRDMFYNRGGLTTWSHTHIITYYNGKRALVTMRGSKYACSRE